MGNLAEASNSKENNALLNLLEDNVGHGAKGDPRLTRPGDLQVLKVHAVLADDSDDVCGYCQAPLAHDRDVYLAHDFRYCSEKCRTISIDEEIQLKSTPF